MILLFYTLSALSLSYGAVIRELRTRSHAKQNLAMLLAGPHDHTWENVPYVSVRDWARGFHDHMISRLLPRFDVSMFITCDESHKQGWHAWSQNFTDLAAKQISLYTDFPSIDATRFTKKDGLCTHPDCVSYWYQYKHIYNSYLAMKAYESDRNVRFDFIVKARSDYSYKPENFLEPWWFDQMSSQTLAVPSTQFHRTDRWAEPVPKYDKGKYMGPRYNVGGPIDRWPRSMCDQIVMGPRPAMDKFFDVLWSKRKLPQGYYDGIEGILAAYLQSEHVSVMTVELQVSQPGGKYVLGYNAWWVSYPCKMCLKVLPLNSNTSGDVR
jgi:hypothetical protein